MAGQANIFQILTSIDDATIDAALAESLPTADDQIIPRIVDTLIQRGTLTGALGLVRHYHHLPESIQASLAAQTDHLYRAIREVGSRGNTRHRLNVIDLVRHSRDTRLAYLLTDLLRHGPLAIAEDAASALHELAHWSISPAHTDRQESLVTSRASKGLAQGANEPDGKKPAKEASGGASGGGGTSGGGTAIEILQLQESIENALAFYATHQQPAVLEAILILGPRPLGRASKILNDPSHPATAMLMQLVKTPNNPIVQKMMLPLLNIPTLTEAVVQGIRFMAKQHSLHLLLDNGHLLRLPSIRQKLATLDHTKELIPSTTTLKAITPHQFKHLPHWLACICHTDAKLIQELANLRPVAPPQAQLAILGTMLTACDRHPVQEVGHFIADYCIDSNETLTRIALRYLIRRQWDELSPLLMTQINSNYASVCKLAGDHLGPVGFENLWNSWSQLSFNQQITAGTALIKIDPSFHVHLEHKLLSHENASTQLRALSMIRTLNQGQFFEQAITQLTQNPNDRIASAAVGALGTSVSNHAVHLLEASLHHSDARVRANTIEALDQMQYNHHVDRLTEIASEDDNRPRANAIGALMGMRFDEALASLTNMLNDEQADHRTSALWLVEHLSLMEMASQIAELAVSDKNPTVRTRASQVIDHFIQAMQVSHEESISDDVLEKTQ